MRVSGGFVTSFVINPACSVLMCSLSSFSVENSLSQNGHGYLAIMLIAVVVAVVVVVVVFVAVVVVVTVLVKVSTLGKSWLPTTPPTTIPATPAPAAIRNLLRLTLLFIFDSCIVFLVQEGLLFMFYLFLALGIRENGIRENYNNKSCI